MADLKISEMDTATDVSIDDLVPIVAGGANFHCSKEDFLTGLNDEVMAFQPGTAGQVVFGIPGNATQCLLSMTDGTLRLQTGGNLTLVGGSVGGFVSITNFDSSTVLVGYDAATPGDWAGAGSPTYMGEALDRIAAALAVLVGSGIP